MKKIVSILLSILLTVVVFGILHVTKILEYNTLITYYISVVILLAMFLIIFLKVFNTESNNSSIPSVNTNVNTFNTIKKENMQSDQTQDNVTVSSQRENFDLTSTSTSSSESEVPKPEYNDSVQSTSSTEVPKPEYNDSVQSTLSTEVPKPEYNDSVQSTLSTEVPKPEPIVNEENTQPKNRENLPYTDIFGNPSSKPVEQPKPVKNTEVHDVPKQNINVDNFQKESLEDKDKKKDFVPLSTFDKISKDEE